MKLDYFHRRDRPDHAWQSRSAPAHRASWSRNSRRWPLYRLAWSISWSFQRAAWDKEPAVPAAMGNDTWKRSLWEYCGATPRILSRRILMLYRCRGIRLACGIAHRDRNML